MCRHRHNRPSAVISEHVITCPNRNSFAVDWIDGVTLEEYPRLLAFHGQPVDIAYCFYRVEILIEFGLDAPAFDKFPCKFTIDSNNHESRTIQSIGTCCVDRDRLGSFLYLELHFSTGRLTNPITLHRQDFVRPFALQLLHIRKKSFGVISNLEIPLIQFLLRYGVITTFAQSRNDLFVGENGLTIRAPIDCGMLAIGKSAFVHL